MKMKNLLVMMLMAIGLLGASNAMAQIAPGTLSEICNWAYTPNNVGGGTPETGSAAYVLFTWETLSNGNIEIRIAAHPDNAGTANDYGCFRGANGLATGGFSLTTGNFSDYFAKSLSADKKAVVLTPTQVIPEGTIIKFNGMCEYKTTNENTTDNGNDLWPSFAFPDYTYGTNCSGEYLLNLDAPSNVSVSASNILTFTEVQHANSYSVMIKLGNTLIKSLTVAGSGETISIPFSGNFEITVVASDNTSTYANSSPSDAYIWASVATDEVVGSSSICETQFGDAAWGLFISIETATENEGNIQAGDVIFTLSGNGAGFRDRGAQLANITVGGVSGANVLTKVSGNLDNPNVFRPVSGLSIAKGTSIVYSGEFEAKSTVNGNIWGARTFNYVYGTACDAQQLATPSNIVIDTDNILTFDGDPNAENHTVYILYGETTLMTISNFVSGNEIVFPVNGTFSLKIASSTSSSEYANSELSEGITFVEAKADQIDLPGSQYCEYNLPITGGLGDIAVVPNVSLETLANGDISVTMNGDHEWRGNGINVNGWAIAGIRAGSLLEKIGGTADNPQIFRPKEGVSIPKGTLMSYVFGGGGVWEWGPGNGWTDAGGAIFTDYVYGSTCAAAPFNGTIAPGATVTITDANFDGDIIFQANDTEGTGQLILPNGNLTVTGAVKIEKTISKHADAKKWYAVGFPFSIASIQCNLPGAEGVNLDAGDDFWLRTIKSDGTFEVLEDAVNTGTTLDANKGYAIQFPDDLTDKVVTFISATGVTLSNDASLASSGSNFTMIANPSVSNVEVPEGNFYLFDNGITFKHFSTISDEVKTLKPFESLIVYNEEGGTPPLKSISISGGEATGSINVDAGKDEIVDVRYYNLQGMEVTRPVENGIYIVKTIFKSNKVETTKQICK